MSVQNLDHIFNPRRIALVGVTQNPNSVGGKVLSNLVGGGFNGVVYRVNPSQEAVLGIQCYPDVAGLPRTPDLAIICSPAEQVPAQVAACGEAGIRGLIIVSAGFKEIADGERRRLVGVGRLIADPGHEEGEYAVLIVDAWQHRRLGGVITDYCVEIAREWKLKRVVAQTTSDNRAMIAVFERRGFSVVMGEESAVDVSKERYG